MDNSPKMDNSRATCPVGPSTAINQPIASGPEVTERVGCLRSSLGALQETIITLSERLVPILSQPTSVPEQDTISCFAPLAQELSVINDGVRDARETLDHLINRLEV